LIEFDLKYVIELCSAATTFPLRVAATEDRKLQDEVAFRSKRVIGKATPK
jgi:hypothetical protein